MRAVLQPTVLGVALLAPALVLASVAPFAVAASQQGNANWMQRLGASKDLLLPLLSSDASLIASAAAGMTLAGPAGLAAVLASGAALSASLLALTMQPAFLARLESWKASVGDQVQVHLTVRSESGAVIDTTHGKGPISFTVGRTEAETDGSSVDMASTSSSVYPGGEEGVRLTRSRAEGLGIQAAGASRFQSPTIVALMDHLSQGLVVGERVKINVHNPAPKDGGFFNPDLVWWQDREDIDRKFKDDVPAAGQVREAL